MKYETIVAQAERVLSDLLKKRDAARLREIISMYQCLAEAAGHAFDACFHLDDGDKIGASEALKAREKCALEALTFAQLCDTPHPDEGKKPLH